MDKLKTDIIKMAIMHKPVKENKKEQFFSHVMNNIVDDDGYKVRIGARSYELNEGIDRLLQQATMFQKEGTVIKQPTITAKSSIEDIKHKLGEYKSLDWHSIPIDVKNKLYRDNIDLYRELEKRRK